MISVNTATDIALSYREIDVAEKLLEDIEKTIASRNVNEDIRDSFGRRASCLQLGVPSGDSGRRLFDLDWELARPIIKAHIEKIKAKLEALNIQAIAEAALAKAGVSERTGE